MVRRVRRFWVVLVAAGVALLAAGTLLLVLPLWSAFSRGQADQAALHSWRHVRPTPTSGATAAAAPSCGSGSPTDYALLTFQQPAQYRYAGVAGNGTWALLSQRSMVHYVGTPDPGHAGNVIIAFHREPDYQHIDELAVGDTVLVQDRTCHTYTYQVTQRWVLAPAHVTQLRPTGGYQMTLITCDPWWQDYQRLVWRLTLISTPAPQTSAPATPGAAPANPQF